ncbi:cytoplasmic tRNA 2-thiolation protein 2 [Dorcoceras hygrometricum]|uniref:Cytoplasmic tRNA 2-thiolation protein 2 n=1 Tax=Dorcoceras hygrometricum TaxID=472368 RepID=A0A2Z7D346_9LAMI|nr:cytoplasmic tRNA 2-thiolation protein 2 [Dorcoceras hygrometricum]
MACSLGHCNSGCAGIGDKDENRRPATQNGELSYSASPGGGDADPSTNCNSLCIKCKDRVTISVSYPSISGGDVGRFCIDCFRGNLYGKFRFAVTSNAMILPSDNLLVGFSGGSSSRVALEFVHKMQEKALKNFDASRDRSLPVFGVGVAFIDERASFAFPSNDFDKAIDEMRLIVSNLTPPAKQFHVVPTEVIFSPDCAAGRAKLTELITSIGDVTGKEDFLGYLRLLSLQKIAMENGYTKIVLGTCTSRIACYVLEATGQGFSLAADIQYADARWEVPVVLPLRDCLSEELNMLCTLDSLKTVEALRQPRSGINGLISTFVKLLQEENPSRESTIVRTAGKLTPFCFNTVQEVDDHKGHLAYQRRHKKYNLKHNESLPPESLCLICRSPLMKSDVTDLNGFVDSGPITEILLDTCSSCQYQILPKDPSSLEYFHSLLPKSMTSLGKNNNNHQKCLR